MVNEKTHGVHMSHCNQGEYEGSCKYGDFDDCPALSDEALNAAILKKFEENTFIKLSDATGAAKGRISNLSQMKAMVYDLKQLKQYHIDED